MISSLSASFILGLLTPLTAVCVLPLYPGFLVYLTNQIQKKEESDKKLPFFLGILVTSGVIAFMFLFGLFFTLILKVSLTKVIGIVSPMAFFLLFLISLTLIIDIDFSKIFPRINVPRLENPIINAFTFGFFFGAIVLPCNPLFITALLLKTSTISEAIISFLSFIFFGIGLAFPLLVFSILSTAVSRETINFFVRQKKIINLFSGIIMMLISLYYLLFVFEVWKKIR